MEICFFKQKTAYEMRFSDWSSDVCSSDLMATGTGKTYTAFQIIWRLWKAGRKKRILFLADRNVLIDQTMVNDFRPFGGVMAKLSVNAKTIEKPDGSLTDLTTAMDVGRAINKSYEVYLGLYQAITGPEDRQKLFRDFSPGFFDLIVKIGRAHV